MPNRIPIELTLAKRVSALEAEVRRLSTLESGVGKQSAWARMVSSYLHLPFLRSYWPGTVNIGAASPLLVDLASGFNLTQSGTPTYPLMTLVNDLVPATWYRSVAANYHYYADDPHFDITGNETNIHSIYNGLTVGCWFQPKDSVGISALLSKWDYDSEDGPFVLEVNSSGYPMFTCSEDGAIAHSMASTEVVTLQNWSLIVGRFDPGVSTDIFHNGVWYKNTTSPQSSLHSGTIPFRIGMYVDSGPTNIYCDGFVCHSFVCAGYVSDEIISALYRDTRGLLQTQKDYTSKVLGI